MAILFFAMCTGQDQTQLVVQKNRLVFINNEVCLATRVSDDLVLTAAHCIVGYDGKNSVKNLNVTVSDKTSKASIIEQGVFIPFEGKMQDWALLKPEDKSVLEGIAVAVFPSKKEMTELLNCLGDFADHNKGAPIYMESASEDSYRVLPRQPLSSSGFISHGFLKSDLAYKKSLLYTILTHHIYDEASSPPPNFNIDAQKKWDEISKKFQGSVFELYDRYKNDDDPTLFHTADYAQGSSGSGIFNEQTNHYLGLIPMATDPVDSKYSYRGRGRLYRIDKICEQSKVLGQMEVCRDLFK